jgi:hypothetical protein
MKKISILFFFTIILGFGCSTGTQISQNSRVDISKNDQQTSTISSQTDSSFSLEGITPQTAKDVKVLDIHFGETQGKVLTYTNRDVVLDNEARNSQHLKVYILENNNWREVKDDQTALENVAVPEHFENVEVFDLTSTTQALFVQKEQDASGGYEKYYVFGKNVDGKFGDFSIPKGYLGDLNILLSSSEKKRGCTVYFDGASAQKQKGFIVETYNVLCNDGNPRLTPGDRYATITQVFDGFNFVTHYFFEDVLFSLDLPALYMLENPHRIIPVDEKNFFPINYSIFPVEGVKPDDYGTKECYLRGSDTTACEPIDGAHIVFVNGVKALRLSERFDTVRGEMGNGVEKPDGFEQFFEYIFKVNSNYIQINSQASNQEDWETLERTFDSIIQTIKFK